MTVVLTQSSAIVKLDYLTTVSIVVSEDNQYLVVADQNYILGSYSYEETARNIISWMAHSIGDCTVNNLCITMPIVLAQKDDDEEDAENG
jgi:hypothetical protein